ncbi:MAG TPA: SIS domain-containing protein [Streptosporangiaceae bacterium]|nr:SIS domain-containing protein [Streptosporangiaceae bacterium]
MTSYAASFLQTLALTAARIDAEAVESMARSLRELRQAGGRIFVVGVGGGAANAAHLVGDLRKIAGIEAYSPWDGVAEMTAWANDESWDNSIKRWLQSSRLSPRDAIVVFSVSGGDLVEGTSPAIRVAVTYAAQVGARILGVVGTDKGAAASLGPEVIVIPSEDDTRVAMTESFQCVLTHLLVFHPLLQLPQPERAELWP